MILLFGDSGVVGADDLLSPSASKVGGSRFTEEESGATSPEGPSAPPLVLDALLLLLTRTFLNDLVSSDPPLPLPPTPGAAAPLLLLPEPAVEAARTPGIETSLFAAFSATKEGAADLDSESSDEELEEPLSGLVSAVLFAALLQSWLLKIFGGVLLTSSFLTTATERGGGEERSFSDNSLSDPSETTSPGSIIATIFGGPSSSSGTCLLLLLLSLSSLVQEALATASSDIFFLYTGLFFRAL